MNRYWEICWGLKLLILWFTDILFKRKYMYWTRSCLTSSKPRLAHVTDESIDSERNISLLVINTCFQVEKAQAWYVKISRTVKNVHVDVYDNLLYVFISIYLLKCNRNKSESTCLEYAVISMVIFNLMFVACKSSWLYLVVLLLFFFKFIY